MDVRAQIAAAKSTSTELALLNDKQRNAVLASLANSLRESIPQILLANAQDLAKMDPKDPKYDRLLLNAARINSIASDIETVISLTNPLGKILEQRDMPNGLHIEKIAVPLGTIAIIYEARPNVTIDVFALCFKAGNACVLKGSKEAYNSNLCLINIIQQCLNTHNINKNAAILLSPNREDTAVLLNAVDLIDVCIPRGGQELINYVRNNAKVPVIETGAGIVHTYFDNKGDLSIAREIVHNAKTRRVSVCNALDCLLIHKDRIKDLAQLVEPLQASKVEIYADPTSFAALQKNYPAELLKLATEKDFGREFLDYKMAIKTVDSLKQAIEHIQEYSSKHSEAIITEDKKSAEDFVRQIDAAAVYVNASTAFTDGAQFGMGSEIGISTQKLHARGPMGLDALTSYKWVIHGNGQIRN